MDSLFGMLRRRKEEARPSLARRLPGPLVTVKKIAVGSFHAMMLSTTDELYGCGSNSHYQLGISGGDRSTMSRIPLPDNVGRPETFALSWYCSLIITDQHQLLGAGKNTSYQLPVIQNSLEQFTAIPTHHVEGGAVLVDAASGFYGTAFVFSNGALYHSGHRTSTHEMEKLGGDIFGGEEKAVQVAYGSYSLFVLTESGAVYSFGDGESTRKVADCPPVRMDWPPMRQVWKGGTRSLAQSQDGRFFAQGSFGGTPFAAPPASATSFSMGNSHALCILKDGRVMSTGESTYLQLGRNVTEGDKGEWRAVEGVDRGSVVAVCAASYHSVLLFCDGRVGTFGWNLNGQLGRGERGGKHGELFIIPGTGSTHWSVVTHCTLPLHVRQSVECMFLVHHVEGNVLHMMPLEVLVHILEFIETS